MPPGGGGCAHRVPGGGCPPDHSRTSQRKCTASLKVLGPRDREQARADPVNVGAVPESWGAFNRSASALQIAGAAPCSNWP